jgi:hypothetical protein
MFSDFCLIHQRRLSYAPLDMVNVMCQSLVILEMQQHFNTDIAKEKG